MGREQFKCCGTRASERIIVFDCKHKWCFSHKPLQRSCRRLPSSINIEICPWPLRDQVMLLLTISTTVPLLILNREKNVFRASVVMTAACVKAVGTMEEPQNYPHACGSFRLFFPHVWLRKEIFSELQVASDHFSSYLTIFGLTYLCSISILSGYTVRMQTS